jgi:hypothetical protein
LDYKASLAQAGLIKDGHLVDIKYRSPEEEALNTWFSHHGDLQQKVLDLVQSFKNWETKH